MGIISHHHNRNHSHRRAQTLSYWQEGVLCRKNKQDLEEREKRKMIPGRLKFTFALFLLYHAAIFLTCTTQAIEVPELSSGK